MVNEREINRFAHYRATLLISSVSVEPGSMARQTGGADPCRHADEET